MRLCISLAGAPRPGRVAIVASLASFGLLCGCGVSTDASASGPSNNAAGDGVNAHDHGPIEAQSQTRVMTFNIRFAGGDRGERSWANRRDAVAECIEVANPDIIGLQEVLAEQADWIRSRFASYAFHGVGRIDGVRRGEFAPIMYRSDRYEPLDAGHFWISTTPDVPGSMSWGTACERMASWIRLRDLQTGRVIAVINTHLDHVSQEARERGIEMIRAHAERLSRDAAGAPCPVIITGDFNASAEGPLSAKLVGGGGIDAAVGLTLRDVYRVADPTFDGDEATYNDWKPRVEGERIDWIFASSEFDVAEAVIDRRMPAGVLPSDHFPVIAVLRLRVAEPKVPRP